MQSLVVTLSIMAGVVPTLAYVLLIYWIDRYEKEPISLLAITFFWGALPAVVLAVMLGEIAHVPLAGFSLGVAEFLSASVIAPLVEESIKALAVYALYLGFRHEFDGVLDGIVYGALIGLGFGMTENVIYFLRSFGDGGWVRWLVTVGMRSVVLGLMHAFYTGIVGASLGYARLTKDPWLKRWAPLAGLGLAMMAHAFHNGVLSMTRVEPLTVLAIAAIGDWTGILLLGALVILSWRREREWIATQLLEEVSIGALARDDYDLLGSPSPRASIFWRIWREQGWGRAWRWNKLKAAAVKLAFAKHHEARGRGHLSTEDMAELRSEMRALGGELGRPLPRAVLCSGCYHPVAGGHRYCTRCGEKVL